MNLHAKMSSVGLWLLLASSAMGQVVLPTQKYTAYTSRDEMHAATDSLYATVTRVSGSDGYTGF